MITQNNVFTQQSTYWDILYYYYYHIEPNQRLPRKSSGATGTESNGQEEDSISKIPFTNMVVNRMKYSNLLGNGIDHQQDFDTFVELWKGWGFQCILLFNGSSEASTDLHFDIHKRGSNIIGYFSFVWFVLVVLCLALFSFFLYWIWFVLASLVRYCF